MHVEIWVFYCMMMQIIVEVCHLPYFYHQFEMITVRHIDTMECNNKAKEIWIASQI